MLMVLFAQSKKAACGGLIRKHEGDWIQGFSRNIGLSTPLSVEIWEIYHDLLAKYGFDLDWGSHSFVQPPPSLVDVILLDALGSIPLDLGG
ncbi:putative ribonuclease H protein At1g65750 family [Senna tora]|uniref:Putative ribonuclease H protein At1g65750 family n=1 Tax=Senna tora TaxID=362788 RepID=A0A834T4P7_9FABA|nr:putative ribonuclease H protein At1g65750 family [Senna tora]